MLAPMKSRGRKPKKYSDELVAELGRRKQAGASYKQLSEEFGIPYPYVGHLYRYRYLGQERPTKKQPKLDIEPAEKNGDPRSVVCQRIKICRHDRCYLHSQCPAYQAWAERYLKVA